MKPTTQHVRPKAWIPFTNFAIVKETPSKVALKDYLFPYNGCEMDPAAFVWGLYGTLSANQGMFLADSYARKHGQISLTVQGWYRVDNFERVRSQIDESIATASGFLHLDRLKTGFREELRELVLEEGEKVIPGWNRELNAETSLNDIMVRHPKLIKAIFNAYRKVNMIVHPVTQMYDPSDQRTLTVATMRRHKKADSRIMAVQVRYLEDRVEVAY